MASESVQDPIAVDNDVLAPQFAGVDIVRQAGEQAISYAAEKASRELFWRMAWGLTNKAGKLGSPAEAVFMIWFLAEADPHHYELQRQVSVEADGSRYRFDFVVSWSPRGNGMCFEPLKVAVEIDGHAFHEKTLDQVTKRNKRDRALQGLGYVVLHFSFSELMRDPVQCVREVITAADAESCRLVDEMIAKGR